MRKRLSRFLASALVLCCLTCAVSAAAEDDADRYDWTLEEYLAYVGAEDVFDAYLEFWDETFQSGTLTIGVFSHDRYFEYPYHNWNSLPSVNYDFRVEVEPLFYSYGEPEELFRRLTDELIPIACDPGTYIFNPYLYYELNSKKYGTVLRVADGGSCRCGENHRLFMVNGVWFQATPYFYELIWPFLPDMVKDEYAGILERLQED